MSAATGNKQIVEAYFESYPDLSLANDEFEPFSKGYQAALKAVIANTSTNADMAAEAAQIAAELDEAIGHICGGTQSGAIGHINEALRQLRHA